MAYIFEENKSFDQDDGSVEVRTYSHNNNINQISWKTDSTTGTITIYAKYHPEADAEPLLDVDGESQLVIDLANPESFLLEGKYVYSFIFEPAGVDETYTPLLTSIASTTN